MSPFTSEIRRQFPQLKDMVRDKKLVYLDNAATTLKPQMVIDAITQHYAHETANIHRGVHYFSELGTQRYEETRQSVRAFINAKENHEIIFTRGTTESVNLVAYTLMFSGLIKAGDEIMISTMEHHSNIVPWQFLAERTGARLVEIPITASGELDLAAYTQLLNAKTKLVSVTWVSNSLGTINPLQPMIAQAHQQGAMFFVDAAQAAPHLVMDVQALDCDFLAFSGHKIYGPTGIGVLYGKEHLLERLPPFQGGGDMIDRVTIKKTTYNTLPYKFEAGTPAIAEGIALASAIEFIRKTTHEAIARHEHELLLYATQKLAQIEDLTMIGTAKNKASLCAFVIKGVHPHDLGTLLDQQGIAVRTGHHCTQPIMDFFTISATTRASFACYNTKEEIDELVHAIIQARKIL